MGKIECPSFFLVKTNPASELESLRKKVQKTIILKKLKLFIKNA